MEYIFSMQGQLIITPQANRYCMIWCVCVCICFTNYSAALASRQAILWNHFVKRFIMLKTNAPLWETCSGVSVELRSLREAFFFQRSPPYCAFATRPWPLRCPVYLGPYKTRQPLKSINDSVAKEIQEVLFGQNVSDVLVSKNSVCLKYIP